MGTLFAFSTAGMGCNLQKEVRGEIRVRNKYCSGGWEKMLVCILQLKLSFVEAKVKGTKWTGQIFDCACGAQVNKQIVKHMQEEEEEEKGREEKGRREMERKKKHASMSAKHWSCVRWVKVDAIHCKCSRSVVASGALTAFACFSFSLFSLNDSTGITKIFVRAFNQINGLPHSLCL